MVMKGCRLVRKIFVALTSCSDLFEMSEENKNEAVVIIPFLWNYSIKSHKT